MAYAVQSDASYELTDAHTLRTGLFLQSDHSISDTASQVLPVDPVTGLPGTTPEIIVDDGSKTEWLYSAYLQDEWKLVPTFTINYGLRFDKFTAYSGGHQVSPRVNMVWAVLPDTTVHAGYSRYFSPPPFELVGGRDVALFQNTTAAAATTQATPPEAERANYYDAGIQQKITPEITIGLDNYYKQSVNLIDEGQFGRSITATGSSTARS
jgi:outer membrane receptor protein involved in Fe transport